MRLLSYNIHGWITIDGRPNVAAVADLLRSTGADVIGLNEVYHPALTSAGPALTWLASQLGMFVAFAACEPWRFPGVDRPAGYGNALLSRTPPSSAAMGLYPAIPGKEQRGYLEAVIPAPAGTTLTVVVTHLHHAEEAARLAQQTALLGSVTHSGRGPDLIMGDFNCIHLRDYDHRPDALDRLAAHPLAGHMVNRPEGPGVAGRMEEAGYTDPFVSQGQLGAGTFIPAEEPVRLDYLWLRSDRLPQLRAVGVIDEPAGQEASDHRPVYLDLDETAL